MNLGNELDKQWLDFYNTVRDASWPEVKTQQDLVNLPKNILAEILFAHIDIGGDAKSSITDLPLYSSSKHISPVAHQNYFDVEEQLEHSRIFVADKIKVYYHPSLDGGGTWFGQRYSHVLSALFPGKTFGSCFEWCSGPGFIGFDLLSRNFCQRLYLSDIYQPCIDSIKKTLDKNQDNIKNNVFYHHGASVADLPLDWKFDLIVSNPPHWDTESEQMIVSIKFNNRICADKGWNLHREFFKNIGKHLNPGATILLQEQSYASGPETFKAMIEENGLKIVDCHWEKNNPTFYYLEVVENFS